ncbi:MAG: O-antigen ligase family protein [Candidatus Eisenbacteria bacterium]
MSGSRAWSDQSARPRRDWLAGILGTLAIVVVGVIAGQQYLSPDKRVLAVAAALAMIGIAWRIDMVSAIGLLLLALPYPRANVYGSTNVALVLLLLIIWLLRANFGGAARARRTPLDLPIVGLTIAYIISFYNIEAINLGNGFTCFILMLTTLATYYLIVNNVRTTRDLERLHVFQAITIALACLIAVFELVFPGRSLVPGWLEFQEKVAEGIEVHNLRVGGPFFDFEQMADFCAVSTLFVLFLLTRARTTRRRVAYGALLILVAFIQFATVTRGGMIALGIGLVYLVWVLRRRINFVQLTVATGVTAAMVAGMNFYVAHFTTSGDLIKRLMDPHTLRLKNGMPEGRSGLWIDAYGRMMEHPLIGHGPYYSLARGIKFWYWPHNVYLYVGNLVGFFGLFFFLWILWRLWQTSRPITTDLKKSSYAAAYLVFGHVQLLVFMIDQLKIDYLRSPIYQFQVWVMFAFLIAAAQLARTEADVVRSERR